MLVAYFKWVSFQLDDLFDLNFVIIVEDQFELALNKFDLRWVQTNVQDELNIVLLLIDPTWINKYFNA